VLKKREISLVVLEHVGLRMGMIQLIVENLWGLVVES
jgi:hypothetical protein